MGGRKKTQTFTGGKNAIKQTALKQTQSVFERKCYSRVCQTACCRGIKCCECKSSLVTEVNKNRMAPCDISESTEFKCRLQGRVDVQCNTCTLAHGPEQHCGLMAFCVSFGVDKKDSATVFGLCQPCLAVQLYSAEESNQRCNW